MKENVIRQKMSVGLLKNNQYNMGDSLKPFFPFTNDALNHITSVFNMVWPIAAGLWNLRCQVSGVKNEFPKISEKQLAAKFSFGSGIHGVNYKLSFIDKSWQEQKEDFAWILLNSSIPVLEAWTEEIEKVFKHTKHYKFQYPDTVVNEIKKGTTHESTIMKNCFYQQYLIQKDNCIQNIDNLLICFRFFKEARNCYMHNGMKANDNLIFAYKKFSQINSPSQLGLQEIPLYITPIKDQIIHLDLRGIVGFSAVLRKTMISIDTELIKSNEAEELFIARWRKVHSIRRVLKSNPASADNQIVRYIKKCDLPVPKSISLIKNFLLQKNLLSR